MTSDKQFSRLFFALWPSDQVRQSIVDVFSAIAIPDHSRFIQPENLHITLHFLGQVESDRRVCLQQVACALNDKPFVVNLDCLGYFTKAKILWMGCQYLPVELVRLHRDLGESLANCGYQSEFHEYKPHVTLMRKCREPLNANNDFVIPWQVDEFALVESISGSGGVRYQVIEKYPLA